MKMSETFMLPLTKERVEKRLGAAWCIRNKASAIAHAVNSHDGLMEHLRLKEEECKQLALDKKELTVLLVSIEEYLGFMEGDFAHSEELHSRVKTLLEKHT